MSKTNEELQAKAEPRYLTKAQLAERLGLTVRGVETLTKRRKLPVIRLSHRCVRYDWEKVERALDACEIPARQSVTR